MSIYIQFHSSFQLFQRIFETIYPYQTTYEPPSCIPRVTELPAHTGANLSNVTST